MDKVSERSGLFFTTFKKNFILSIHLNVQNDFSLNIQNLGKVWGFKKMIAYPILLGICGTNFFLLSQ